MITNWISVNVKNEKKRKKKEEIDNRCKSNGHGMNSECTWFEKKQNKTATTKTKNQKKKKTKKKKKKPKNPKTKQKKNTNREAYQNPQA